MSQPFTLSPRERSHHPSYAGDTREKLGITLTTCEQYDGKRLFSEKGRVGAAIEFHHTVRNNTRHSVVDASGGGMVTRSQHRRSEIAPGLKSGAIII